MPSRKILMHSFKGGAGRTVTTANVAYVLARELHKKVLVIDLDVESAGLSVLYGLHREVDSGACWAIQDLLREYFEPPLGDSPRVSIVLNHAQFEEDAWRNMHRTILETREGGFLKVVPARTVFRSTEERKPGNERALHIFERFVRKIDAFQRDVPDIVLFDSASGLQESALAGLSVSHDLVTFVRWSRQFVYGTQNFLREYICTERFGPRLRRVIVVPTAVPDGPPSARLAARWEERQEQMAQTIAQLSRDASRDYNAPAGWMWLERPIRECPSLKWDDRVFLMEEDGPDAESTSALDDYRHLARILANYAER